MHALLRDFDWDASAFGQPRSWPKSLWTIVNLMLDSAFPMCLSWGPEFRLIYNDAYLPVVGQKHPAALGARMQDVFAELWPDIGPIAQRAIGGESCFYENFPAAIIRHGRASRGWFTFSYTPIRDDHGRIAGLICIATETTEQVLMERRQAFQLDLSDHLRRLSDPGEIIEHACRLLGLHLEAARVGYLEPDPAQKMLTVRHEWTRGELPTFTGQTWTIDDFGAAGAQLRAGQVAGVDGALAIPLVKDGRLCAVFSIHGASAHAWTADESSTAEDAAQRVWAALERATADEQRRRAEQELQRNAALQAFQLELSDTLRALTDADEILRAAASLLGRHLGMSRVLYAQVDEADKTFQIRQEWVNEGIASVAGRTSKLDDFGSRVISALRSGQTVAVDDIIKDERTASHASAYAKVGIRSFLAVPLATEGRLGMALLLQHHEPFRWKDPDIERARAMAERTWSYMETARAQAALRAERDQSRYVFDTMTEGFAMLDPDCTLVQMNAEGRRIGEVTELQVIGRKVWEVWPKVRTSGLADLYHQVMATGKGGSVEYRRTFPDHRVSWVEVRAYPVLDGGLAVFYRDINERKQAEEKLKEADRRKDEFLAMLAHELRNPLAPIAAAAQLLSAGRLDEQDVKHSSEVIARQVGHMTSLVNDLLDMSRVTSGLVAINRVLVDLNAIVPEAMEQVEPLIKARAHRLTIQRSPVPPMVLGDRTRLVQVLANLLNNAAKYTPMGGEIAVRVDAQEDYVALAVRDNGMGMSPELLERAFALFEQAERTPDRTQGGLGIGLALVKAIVELHGGTVIAHSAGVGLGSEFLVLLPRNGEHTAVHDRPVFDALRAPAGMPELKILIVDDNVDAARMLAMLMKVAGHRAFVEHQPELALQLARSVRPDVCLLDIGLPGMSGSELARRLRSQPETSSAVLIAVTGYSLEHGSPGPEFDHHLVKPIETGRLLKLLRRIGTQ